MISSTLSKVFGPSPFQSLQDHILKVHETVEHLPLFFKCVFAGQWVEAQQVWEAIAQCDAEAEQVKSRIRRQLSKNLFLPVARSDLLELLSMQDRVADTAKDVAGVVLGRRMVFFPELRDQYHDYLTSCIAVSAKAKDLVFRLDDLLETVFNEAMMSEMHEEMKQLAELEAVTDRQQVALRRLIFEHETPGQAVNIMFYYKVIELTGAMADYAEKVGHRLEIVLAR